MISGTWEIGAISNEYVPLLYYYVCCSRSSTRKVGGHQIICTATGHAASLLVEIVVLLFCSRSSTPEVDGHWTICTTTGHAASFLMHRMRSLLCTTRITHVTIRIYRQMTNSNVKSCFFSFFNIFFCFQQLGLLITHYFQLGLNS